MCVSLMNFQERERAGESKNTGPQVENGEVGGKTGTGARSGRGGETGREWEGVGRA